MIDRMISTLKALGVEEKHEKHIIFTGMRKPHWYEKLLYVRDNGMHVIGHRRIYTVTMFFWHTMRYAMKPWKYK